MKTAFSRIVLALALALGASTAMATNGQPDSFIVNGVSTARYFFIKPTPTKCQTGGCTALTAAVKTAPGADGPTATAPGDADPADVVLAEQHIGQAWQLLYKHLTGGIGNFNILDTSALLQLYTITGGSAAPVQTLDGQGRVVAVSGSASGSITRGGIPTGVCAAIASKGLAGAGCSGGTLSVSIHHEVTHNFVQGDGSVVETPVSSVLTWHTASPAAVFAATPSMPSILGVIAGV